MDSLTDKLEDLQKKERDQLRKFTDLQNLLSRKSEEASVLSHDLDLARGRVQHHEAVESKLQLALQASQTLNTLVKDKMCKSEEENLKLREELVEMGTQLRKARADPRQIKQIEMLRLLFASIVFIAL
jgi:hypothetical protein